MKLGRIVDHIQNPGIIYDRESKPIERLGNELTKLIARINQIEMRNRAGRKERKDVIEPTPELCESVCVPYDDRRKQRMLRSIVVLQTGT